MAEEQKKKKYRCLMCGEIVEANPDGSCPICGAGPEYLEPVEDEEN